MAVKYATGIGNDTISNEFVEFTRSLGVDPTPSVIVPDKTLGMYWITMEEGEREFQYWRGDSAARHALRDGMSLPEPGTIEVLTISGITLAVAGSGAARLIEYAGAQSEVGVMVCVDVNYRAALWRSAEEARAALELAATAATVVKASVDDIRAIWGMDTLTFGEAMTALGVREVLTTDGPGPVVVVTNEETFEVTTSIADAVDTTGAGDAFFGTYIGGRCGGADCRSATAAAVEVADRATRSHGALSYLIGSD